MPADSTSQLLIPAAAGAVGGLFVALTAGMFTLRVKRNEFVNEYYSEVIRRRLEAYEAMEKLIVSYKTTVVDKDCKPYHAPFATRRQNDDALVNLCLAMDKGLWINDKTFDKMSELNFIIFRTPESEKERIEFGKEHYEAVAQLREDLEKLMAADLIELHKVRRFLRRKKRSKRGFHPVQLYPPKG